MKVLRNLPLQPRRDAWVEVNLGAIEDNARAIRRAIPEHVALMAIVKADAYGHGAPMVLQTLAASGVSMVGVASIDEAIHLRESGIKLPILVIGGIPDWAAQAAAQYDIQLTIFDTHHLDSLRHAYPQVKKPFKVHIKVDTGMHRIGIQALEAISFVQHCQQQPYLQVEGLFSHLADSHNPNLIQQQQATWRDLVRLLPNPPRHLHLGNTGYALTPEVFHGNQDTLARLGIAFFGYGLPPKTVQSLTLRPAMSLKARIVHLQDVPPCTGVSYGHRYTTPSDRHSRIATIPLGYADGVPRALSNRIEALFGGQRIPQVGAITMDQMMFDVSTAPQAQIGDTITLLGQDQDDAIWLDDWAQKTETIVYELMCALRVRLPKTYTR